MQPFARLLYRTLPAGFGAQDTSGAGVMSFARSEKFGNRLGIGQRLTMLPPIKHCCEVGLFQDFLKNL